MFVDLAFPEHEYATRIARLRARMQQRGIDLLLVTNASNIAYLTGYIGESSYVPQLLVVALDADPVMFMREMDVGGCWHTSWLPRNSVFGYPEHLVGDPEGDPYAWIFERVRDRTGARTGAELGEMTSGTAAKFAWQRIEKSELEIQRIREACDIADKAMQRAYECIRPGVRECEAAAEIQAALIRGTPAYGGHGAFAPYMPAASRSGTAHLTWTDHPYQAGTHVNLEIGASRYAYAGAIMRTVSLGAPNDRLRRLHAATMEAHAAAREQLKPGALCEDIATAFSKVVRQHGFEKRSRCGYPIGIHWLEPTASLRVGDRTALRPNMTFHLMLGMWVEPEFGLVYSETVRINETGFESLCNTPFRLEIVE
jgi:ectoine hydrolase